MCSSLITSGTELQPHFKQHEQGEGRRLLQDVFPEFTEALLCPKAINAFETLVITPTPKKPV